MQHMYRAWSRYTLAFNIITTYLTILIDSHLLISYYNLCCAALTALSLMLMLAVNDGLRVLCSPPLLRWLMWLFFVQNNSPFASYIYFSNMFMQHVAPSKEVSASCCLVNRPHNVMLWLWYVGFCDGTKIRSVITNNNPDNDFRKYPWRP